MYTEELLAKLLCPLVSHQAPDLAIAISLSCRSDKDIKAPKKKNGKDAAFAVSEKAERSRPQSDESVDYLRESKVQEMSADEYEKHQEDIMEAIRSDKFIYDISGSAR